MCIFTKYGFFSVVKKGDQVSGPGGNDVVVRSRASGFQLHLFWRPQ